MLSRLCGLNVQSNHPIPGLEACASEAPVDLEVCLAQGHPWTPADDGGVNEGKFMRWDERGEPLLKVTRSDDGRYFHFSYSDGTDFTIDSAGRKIWGSWKAPYSLEDATTYLLGPVMGFTLRRRGRISMHASAFATVDGAVAISGAAGAGKSTTATAFARRGFPVLTDDMVPLSEEQGQFFALPTYPRMRLWSDSVETFYGSGEALPPLTPNWDKKALDLKVQGYHFESSPLPILAIYFLDYKPESRPTVVEGLHGQQALMALVNNTYVNYLLDAEMRAVEFELLGRMWERLPLRCLRLAEPRPRPDEVCALILDDLAGLGMGTEPRATTVDA